MKNEAFEQAIAKIMMAYQRETGLDVQYISKEELETGAAGAPPCRLCRLMRKTEEGASECINHRKVAAKSAERENEGQFFICGADLMEWVIPVFFKNEIRGHMFSGFIYNEQKGVPTLLEQSAFYKKCYGIERDDLTQAAKELLLVSNEKAIACMQLLQALVRLYGLSYEEGADEGVEIRDTEDVIGFLKEEEMMEELPTEHPLSYYINEGDGTGGALAVFWKSLESRAGDVFNCVISGRALEGRLAFEEIMDFAYAEQELDYVKTGAEMLFHIIFLKYYSKKFFDTRFYQLAFDTVNQLLVAENVEKIREIMSGAYRKIYTFYNGESSIAPRSSISKNIIKYLEANYEKDIKVEDVGKYLYMSPAYLNRIFKSETGTTIKQCLTDIRMKHAQKLLLHTKMPVKDIGYVVGYKNDIRGFYKMFQKHFGMTCTEMRKKKFYMS